MNQKLTLPQNILIAIICIAITVITLYIPSLSILTVLVSTLFVVIGALSDKKGILISVTIMVLALVFFVNPVYVLDTILNCVIPGIIIGIITKKVLGYENNNKFEPVFAGTIVFILCLIANYIILKYIFDINLLDNFINIMRDSLAQQMNILKESMESLSSTNEITVDSIMNTMLNIMPLLLFFRAIFLAILTYFLAIFVLKKMRNMDLKEIKFSRFYLPGNAILTSFVFYIIMMLLEVFNIPLYTDLILMNLELVFYSLFLIQGVAVSIYFIKKWFRNGITKKGILAILAVILFGFMGISILGMVDCIFDFRKVRSCESI